MTGFTKILPTLLPGQGGFENFIQIPGPVAGMDVEALPAVPSAPLLAPQNLPEIMMTPAMWKGAPRERAGGPNPLVVSSHLMSSGQAGKQGNSVPEGQQAAGRGRGGSRVQRNRALPLPSELREALRPLPENFRWLAEIPENHPAVIPINVRGQTVKVIPFVYEKKSQGVTNFSVHFFLVHENKHTIVTHDIEDKEGVCAIPRKFMDRRDAQ